MQQATLPTRRTFEGTAAVYQGWGHAVASLIGALFTLLTLAFSIMSYGAESQAALLGMNVAACALGIVMAFLWTSAITFRSAVLLEGPAFRRVAIVQLLGLVANEAVFAAGTFALDAESAELAYRIVVFTLVAAFVQLVVTFVGMHVWGYRVFLPAPEKRLLAGEEWQRETPTDVELISIAAGERQLSGFWQMRGWVLSYAVAFTGLLSYGWFSTVILGMTNGDGTARVVQAFQVLFSREPHLAAMGFVWPPIPAFTNIPLVALLRPLGYTMFAGSLMGAFYGAGAVVAFASVLRALGANRLVTAVLTAALATNQYFYQSTAAGLSEPVLAFFLLASLRAYIAWLRDPQPQHVMYAGLACAGGLMCRYEAAVWTAAMALAFMVTLYEGIPGFPYLRTPGAGSASAARLRMSSSVWAFLAPTAFVIMVWVILNQQIAGSPLYFLNGPGSTRMSPDTAKLAGEGLAAYSPQGLLVFHAYHSISGTVIMLLDRAAFFSPHILLASVMTIPFVVFRRDYRVLGILGIVWSITVFALITGYLGSFPPYQRYWYWLGPMGIVLSTYGIVRVQAWGARVLLWVVLVMLAFSPNVRTFQKTYAAFDDAQPTNEERLRNALFSTPDLGTVGGRQELVTEWQALATEVNKIPPEQVIILDVAGPGGPLLLYVQHVQRFITTTDIGFADEILPELPLHASYILLPEPTYDVQSRSIVMQRYLGIWEGQLPWAKVVQEFPGQRRWRLLQLIAAPKGLQPQGEQQGIRGLLGSPTPTLTPIAIASPTATAPATATSTGTATPTSTPSR
ncbi:MAG: hypothetical protein DWI48_02075 [Chloroflexi bacterium]|nr:MAG: hypothetical protein DWI48_02075 [Chloroflexota bacterium]